MGVSVVFHESRTVRQHGVPVTQWRVKLSDGRFTPWRHTVTGAYEEAAKMDNGDRQAAASGIGIHPDSTDQL